MTTRLAAVVLTVFCVQSFLLAQNPPPVGVTKLGKLRARDNVSIAFHRAPDREGGMMDLEMTFSIFEDGTIRVPFLGKVPAAGLSVFELAQTLKDQYNAYFALPPMATANPAAHVVVQFIGHGGKSGIDSIIERIGKTTLR
jgi:protein involved in polysaccharide export with SLBB domain